MSLHVIPTGMGTKSRSDSVYTLTPSPSLGKGLTPVLSLSSEFLGQGLDGPAESVVILSSQL